MKHYNASTRKKVIAAWFLHSYEMCIIVKPNPKRMNDAAKKSKTRIAAVAVLFIVLLGNYMRHPHDGIRAVEFVQILGMGMLLGVLLMRTIQAFKSN